jgi:outer membrane autotransporter protein
MGCESRPLSSMEPRRGVTSRVRAGCRFVLSTLLAAIALFAASTVSTRAQTNWIGAVSSNWFVGPNWNAGIPTQTRDAVINTVAPNATVVASPGAITNNLTVGANGTGMLTIQAGGTLVDQHGAIGNLPGGVGMMTVTGPGSDWSNVNDVVVGGLGTGTLIIQGGATAEDDTTVSSTGISVGLAAGSTGTVTVTGPGSRWTNGPSGGLNIGSFGTGTLMIANGGSVIDITSLPTNIGQGAGSQGTATVTDPGSLWSDTAGIRIGNSGTGTLTIANGGVVTAPTVVIANNAGSIGTLNIGAVPSAAAAAPGTLIASSGVAFGAGTGTINFNHTSTNYVFAPAISGNGTVDVFAGTTTFTNANSYLGPTNVFAGTLQAGALNTFSPNSAVTVAGGGTLDLHGFSQTVPSVTNSGLVNMGTGTAPGTMLTTPSYTGTGGTLALNTYLAGDDSPSDKLVIIGGGAGATGNSFLRITNAGGPGAETVANGIQVVSAINGGTTVPGAFMLSGEVRAGAFDYDLFRGGVGGSSPNDWFLRSTFMEPPPVEPGPEPPIPPFPTEPPPTQLPPGVYPIIGPELATYGVVQPVARQLGLTTLGTMHERIGDTLTLANAGADSGGSNRPDWGRFFGEQIDNRYQAFADPRASGWLGGFQGGLDLWRGSLLPGQRDVAGVYFSYGHSEVGVNGLVTNPSATNYMLTHTGTVDLNAFSTGGYWTHYGPSGWYLDAVVQGTVYTGTAATQFAQLPTNGFGFISSLEAGYPVALPLGPRFVLEPQAQIIWQQVTLNQANDGLGSVALGTTSGATGRVGMRGMWTIVSDSGQVWQPYVRANLWRDWGAQATTTFGIDQVPLLEAATRLELAGGITAKLNAGLSLYAQAGYQFAVADANDGTTRNGVKGDAGFRYTW